MSRLFLSHSSANNVAAVALNQWLAEQGYGDVFLDIDSAGGLLPGDKWQDALRAAAGRCEAVLFLVSPAWLKSRWCLAEFLLAKSLHKRIFGILVETVDLAEIPMEMTAEWQLCDLTGQEGLRSFAVTVQDRPETIAFPQTALALLRRGLDRAGLDASSFPWPPPGDPGRIPYRGLNALDSEDAAVFFGRDAMIVRGKDRIKGLLESGVERTLIILGASGSGKSSFLRAGLWPRMARDDTNYLPLPVIRPERAAMSGSAGLVVALADAFGTLGAPKTPGRIKAMLAQGDDPLGDLFDELLAAAKRRLVTIDPAAIAPAIVISIDQAEELFNADGAAEAAQVFDLLGRAFRSEAGLHRRMLILATMRTDRYQLLQTRPELAGVKRELFDLPPIPRSEFKSVIEGPVGRLMQSGRRFAIEAELTEQLIADSRGADALPLLAFTLERLYVDFGGEGELTCKDYDQIGGVQGSIEAAVKQALSNPGRVPVIPEAREAQLACLRAAFIPWLARIDPASGQPSRRVARFDDLPADSRPVIERLIEARLLVADRYADVNTVEVAHESLLRQWPALTKWLQDDQDDLKLVESVERAAREWDSNGRQHVWLDHRADRLAKADALTSRADFQRRLSEIDLAYLAACGQREDAERQDKEAALVREQARLAQIAKAQRRAGRLLAAVALILVLGVVGGLWLGSILAAQRAKNQTQEAALSVQQGWVLAVQQWANEATQAALQTQQNTLEAEQVSLIAGLAATQRLSNNLDGALRLAINDTFLNNTDKVTTGFSARAELAAAYFQSGWRLNISGHTGGVSSAAFSPDGSKIVTSSYDGTAGIWDSATGAKLFMLLDRAAPSGRPMEVSSATFSADGRLVVTASKDGTARVWDVGTGALRQVLKDDTAGLNAAGFNNDGTKIVTASERGTVRIWDVATGAKIRDLAYDQQPVWAASFNAAGDRIVTASEDGAARIWDVATGQQLAELRDAQQGHAGGVWSAAFSPDGKHVVTASYDTYAIIWDSDSGKLVRRLEGHQDWVMSAAYNHAGTRIVTASQDGTALVWDPETGKTVATLAGHEGGVLSAAFSPNDRSIVTASFDHTARVWDVASSTPLATMAGHTDKIWSAAFSPDGRRVVTASQDNTARIWDAKTGKQIGDPLIGHSSWVLYAAFSPDGSKIVTASQDDTARIWDARTGKQIGDPLVGHEGGVMMAEFSHDGTRIVTASLDHTARIWDAATGKQLLKLIGPETGMLTAAFSPDGTKIVTGAYDETAEIWDARTGAPLVPLLGHTGGVWDAHFNADGTRVVTASEDRTARIWDATTGKELQVLRGHENWVWSALFSSDGKQIVTGSEDHTARVWNAEDGIEIGILHEIEGGIYFAEFSPDGQEIVTASDDNLTNVWRADFSEASSRDLVADICTHRLGGVSKLTRDEMRLAGYPDAMAPIDVCLQRREQQREK